ncbi:histone-lysine N-methyltransferase SETDB2 isoform 2-T4 [Discoglossus pictus]
MKQVEHPISSEEAEKFWKEQQTRGNVDVIFEQIQNKVQLLWQKIKNGSATSQEYLRAMLLVNGSGLDVTESACHEKSIQDAQQENKECVPTITEEPCLDISSECEPEVVNPHGECGISLPPVKAQVTFKKHTCNRACLLDVHPYRFRKENPMKLPILCHFQRRHGKSNFISRELDVIYKAPCGRSLRNYEELRSYLFETDCRYLFVDNFSFNTYLQLDRNLSNNQPIVQDYDISKDVESVPVSFCNEIDGTKPSAFKYRKSSWPCGYSINNYTDIFIDSCNCTDGCWDVLTCACLQMTARGYNEFTDSPTDDEISGYKYKRLQAPIPSGLYECNLSCKCDRRMCQNRVVQHGLQNRLQVFKTKKMGWGVRCLDDIDQGTFVCTYAGRILVKSMDANLKGLAEQSDSSDNHDEEDKSKIISSVIVPTRKRRISHSDSEITLLHMAPYSRNKMTETSSSSHGKHEITRKKAFSGKGLNLSVKRPKTKTSILQKRRKQLIEEGACTLQHSSEDEYQTPPSSVKEKQIKRTGVTQEDCNANKDVSPAGSELLKTKETSEVALGYVSDESNASILSGIYPLSESTCDDKTETGKTVSLHSSPEENVCILDATKEGNVGRFLNHSCSPNLFVQNVFVETHHKSFPWVAFFTKKLVRAGTELTWGYNYDVGSDPEKEVPCRCGHQTCKSIAI